jgi:putative copper export protein/methionine-rich copper-binding protein CopC
MTPARRLVAGLVALITAALMTLALAWPAQAHTELVDSTPGNGTTLKKLPAHATLVFDEEVSAKDLTVLSGNASLPVSPAPGKPTVLQVDLSSVKPAATVHLVWTMVSEHDGHESSGVIMLHVRGAAAATSLPSVADTGSESPLVDDVALASRALGYLSMAVLVGGLLFISLLWPAGAGERRTHLLLGVAAATGLVASVTAAGVVVWRAGENTALADALAEDVGRADAAMVLLWLLATVVVVAVVQGGESVVRQLPWRFGAAVVGAGLIRTTGMNAHAVQTDEPNWGIAADFLHLIGISAWVGGLTVLSVCLLPRRRLTELEQVVPRFSKVAAGSVMLIVASGLILTWQIISTVDGFWSTHYADVLIVKISLFSLVLLVAMNSKRWVQKSLARAVVARRRNAVKSFAVSVAAESVLVVAVLGAASVLTTSSPGV